MSSDVVTSTILLWREYLPRRNLFFRMSSTVVKPIPPTIIKSTMVMLMMGFATNCVRDENPSPTMSNPALQNADIEWNRLYQIPIAPNSLQNTGSMHKKPTNSAINVKIMANFVNLTIPPMFGAEMVSLRVVLASSPIFRFVSRDISVANETTPRPPICIKMMITTCPNADQYVAVSTTTSPVTQIAEVAVKNEFIKPAHSPLFVENGSNKSIVPSAIAKANPNAIICALVIFFNNFLIVLLSLLQFLYKMRVKISIEALKLY